MSISTYLISNNTSSDIYLETKCTQSYTSEPTNRKLTLSSYNSRVAQGYTKTFKLWCVHPTPYLNVYIYPAGSTVGSNSDSSYVIDNTGTIVYSNSNHFIFTNSGNTFVIVDAPQTGPIAQKKEIWYKNPELWVVVAVIVAAIIIIIAAAKKS